MKIALYVVLLFPLVAIAQEGVQSPTAGQAIYEPGTKSSPAENSFSIECKKKTGPLEAVIACYKCCVGESSGKSCEPFHNEGKAKRKMKCGCD